MARQRIASKQAQASAFPGIVYLESLHTQQDAAKSVKRLSRRATGLLWAMVALQARTGSEAATYRALVAMLGLKDKKSLRGIVIEGQQASLVTVEYNERLGTVRMTPKCHAIAMLLLNVIPAKEYDATRNPLSR